MKSEYTVKLLRRGHVSRENTQLIQKCNTLLIDGPSGYTLVNPGSPWDSDSLSNALNPVEVQSINHVICTDGCIQRVGSVGCFKNAEMIIIGQDIMKRADIFIEHDFADGSIPYEFDENFYVVGTIGHRGKQVSLFVNGKFVDPEDSTRNFEGLIGITGNLFKDEQDASHASCVDSETSVSGDIQSENDYSIDLWLQSRRRVLQNCDWIVPDYGPVFKVKPEYASVPCVKLA